MSCQRDTEKTVAWVHHNHSVRVVHACAYAKTFRVILLIVMMICKLVLMNSNVMWAVDQKLKISLEWPNILSSG